MRLIFSIISIIVFCGCFNQQPVRTGQEGKQLPHFTLLLSDSITYVNSSTMHVDGQPIVLFYYSPQCPYCRAQMADMVNDIKNLKDIKMFIVTAQPFKEMKSFITQYNLNNYNNIIAGADVTHFFSGYFSLTGVPFTAIYGKDKKLKEAYLGKIDTRQIKIAADK